MNTPNLTLHGDSKEAPPAEFTKACRTASLPPGLFQQKLPVITGVQTGGGIIQNPFKSNQQDDRVIYEETVKAKQNLSILEKDESKIKNRINLLQKEQQRIIKKIEKDRERAEKIRQIQERNDNNYLKKLKH